MSMKRITTKSGILVAALIVAAISAGGVLAAQLGGWGSPDELASAIREDPAIRVADIASDAGLPKHGVFVQKTSTGHLCLWDAPSAASPNRGGGCNTVDDPLGGRTLRISFAFDGGPAVADVKDARLIGLAELEVATVQVLMSDGTRREVQLRKASVGGDEYQAFGYRFKKGDLRRGVAPTAVIGLNAAGQEIDRQATGFAG
jgi:hypothetical protein